MKISKTIGQSICRLQRKQLKLNWRVGDADMYPLWRNETERISDVNQNTRMKGLDADMICMQVWSTIHYNIINYHAMKKTETNRKLTPTRNIITVKLYQMQRLQTGWEIIPNVHLYITTCSSKNSTVAINTVQFPLTDYNKTCVQDSIFNFIQFC